jgi:hypothetical protein
MTEQLQPAPANEAAPVSTRWSLWAALRDPNGYLLLLILTIAQLAIWTLVLDRNIMLHIVAYWLLVSTMIVALHRSQVHPKAFRIALVALLIVGTIWTLALAITFGRNSSDNNPLIGGMALVYAVMLAVTFPLIVRRAFAHRVVNVNTMCAALSAYMFIGLFFAALVRAVGAFGPTFYAQRAANNSANAVYFAFESLTTLGQGDLTPVPGIARVITIFCALAGQLYLVTAVARTVSLFGQERHGKLVD